MRSTTIPAVLALVVSSTASAQSTITLWDFQNYPITPTLTNAPDASVGLGFASVLGMDNHYGTPGPSVAAADVFRADVGSSDPIQSDARRAWRIRGGRPAGATQNANGWSSLAPQYSQGAQFLVSTVGYENIAVSFDIQVTTRGVKNWQLQYTIDGVLWTNIGALGTSAGSDLWNNNQGFDFAASGITSVNNNALFGLRVVSAYDPASGTYIDNTGAPINNSSGNWRFDMVRVSGTLIPTPGSTALLALAGFVAHRRRR